LFQLTGGRDKLRTDCAGIPFFCKEPDGREGESGKRVQKGMFARKKNPSGAESFWHRKDCSENN